MQDLSRRFVEWVKAQDPEEDFDPWLGSDVGSKRGCAGFQFLKAHGFPVEECLIANWRDTDGREHSLPVLIANAIDWACDLSARRRHERKEPKVSFGALAEHLSPDNVIMPPEFA